MATVKTYLDKRRSGDNEPAPVKIAITQNAKVAYINTNVKCLPSDFNAKSGSIVGGSNAAFYNSVIQKAVLRCQMAIVELTDAGRITRMSASEIKQYIDGGGCSPEVVLFTQYFEKEIEKKKTQGTKELYRNTLAHIRAFDNKADNLSFGDISAVWLRRLDDYFINIGLKTNTRNLNFRNIRAVCNAAINDEITTAYPFRRFAIKNEPTAKRNLSVLALRFFYSMPLSNIDAYYRDLFFLSLFLVGINPTDLFNAETSADGRLRYKRAKTGKLYDIKIEPEAQHLIDKHRGENGRLIDACERFSNSHNFTKQMDISLKRCVPGISQYWCRHSWATVAAELDIPIETISAALGHSYGSRITNIYIEFNTKKIDDANRRVIDFILYNKR